MRGDCCVKPGPWSSEQAEEIVQLKAQQQQEEGWREVAEGKEEDKARRDFLVAMRPTR